MYNRDTGSIQSKRAEAEPVERSPAPLLFEKRDEKMKLTEDQLNEIDDSLLTGKPVSEETAGAIQHTYGVNPNSADLLADIAARYNHPSVGTTGRRALDALRIYIVS